MTNEEAVKMLRTMQRTVYLGNRKFEDAIECAIKALSEPLQPWEVLAAQSVLSQPEPHWIPVTERLPEDNIPVNVTWVNRNPEPYYSDIKDKPYTATAVYFRGKWFWYSCVIEDWLSEYGSNESLLANLQEAVDRDIEIVAWCELPEPFKGVTE